jgi:nucleotide-binding universal stress UspA family protein
VGADGSECARQALEWAADEAARHGLPLRIVHGSRWEPYEDDAAHPPLVRAEDEEGTGAPGDPESRGGRLVAAAAEWVRESHPGLPVTRVVIADEPAAALLAAARDSFCLVVGQHGRRPLADLLLGSVSRTAAAHARCPVVVVRGGERQRLGGFGCVTLAVGEPEHCAAATAFALREAAVRGCVLEAVHAWRWGPSHASARAGLGSGHGASGDSAGGRLRAAEAALGEVLADAARSYPGVEVRPRAVDGTAREVLLTAAAASDLLVTGGRPRGSGAMHPARLGSTQHALLHHAPCPVAVVAEPPARA